MHYRAIAHSTTAVSQTTFRSPPFAHLRLVNLHKQHNRFYKEKKPKGTSVQIIHASIHKSVFSYVVLGSISLLSHYLKHTHPNSPFYSLPHLAPTPAQENTHSYTYLINLILLYTAELFSSSHIFPFLPPQKLLYLISQIHPL